MKYYEQCFEAFLQAKNENFSFLPNDVVCMIEDMYYLHACTTEELIQYDYNEVYKKYVKFKDAHVKYFLKHNKIELLVNVFLRERKVNPKYKLSEFQKKQLVHCILKNGNMKLLPTLQNVFDICYDTQCFVDAMVSAVEGNSFETVKWVHENISEKVWSKCRVALQALQIGNFEIVKYIYKNKLNDPSDFSENKYSEIDILCMNGHLELLEWFRETLQNQDRGRINLSYQRAIEKGKLEVLKWMDENFEISCCQKMIINKHCISIAVANGHLSVLKYIYEKYDCKNVFRDVCWDHAASQGHLEILKWYQIQDPFSFANYFYPANLSTTTIILAAENGHVDTVDWLHKSFNTKINPIGCVKAARLEHLSLVKWFYENFEIEPLIEKKVLIHLVSTAKNLNFIKNINFNLSNFTVETLQSACKSGDMEMINWVLLQMKNSEEHHHKVDSSIEELRLGNEIILFDFHQNILHYVAFAVTNLEVVKWVHLHFKSDVDLYPEREDYCLNFAASNPNPEILKWLYFNRKKAKITETMIKGIEDADTMEWVLKQQDYKTFVTPNVYEKFVNNKNYDIVKLFLSKRMPFSAEAKSFCQDERILEMLNENMNLCV